MPTGKSGGKPPEGVEKGFSSGREKASPDGLEERIEERMLISGKGIWRAFRSMMPVITGVLLLVSLLVTAVPKEFYSVVFTGNAVVDSLGGAIFGSIAAGNPIESYIIGGELLKNGLSLFAITAFIVAWVTVGMVQLPAESCMLGKRFALVRNMVSFVLAIVAGVVTVLTLGLVR